MNSEGGEHVWDMNRTPPYRRCPQFETDGPAAVACLAFTQMPGAPSPHHSPRSPRLGGGGKGEDMPVLHAMPGTRLQNI
jgi:hypothetical protein